MAVISTSTVAVNWAETWSDSTMRLAMVWRSLDIFSVVPRSVLTSAAAVAGAAGAAEAGSAGASGAGAAAACFAASAAARTSCLRIRPPTPVPLRVPRSTPCSLASLRTSGVT